MNRITFPLKQAMQGSTVADLQDALLQCLERAAILATNPTMRHQLTAAVQPERTVQTYGPATHNVVVAFQQDRHLLDPKGAASGNVDAPTADALNTLLAEWGLLPPPASNTLQGTLTFDNGMPAASVTVRLYNIGFGGLAVQVPPPPGGDVKSDSQGKYAFTYAPPNPTPPNLQVRVLDSTGEELIISATKFNVGQSETLNLIVPASVQPLASEFQRLSADISKFIGDIAKLGQALENADRQHLTLLDQAANESRNWT